MNDVRFVIFSVFVWFVSFAVPTAEFKFNGLIPKQPLQLANTRFPHPTAFSTSLQTSHHFQLHMIAPQWLPRLSQFPEPSNFGSPPAKPMVVLPRIDGRLGGAVRMGFLV